MKINDCPLWPCDEYIRQGHLHNYDYITRGDIRRIHALHQIETMFVGETRTWIVGTKGVPWKQLLHKGKKP